MTRTAVSPEREGDLIRLELAELQAGQTFESPCERGEGCQMSPFLDPAHAWVQEA